MAARPRLRLVAKPSRRERREELAAEMDKIWAEWHRHSESDLCPAHGVNAKPYEELPKCSICDRFARKHNDLQFEYRFGYKLPRSSK